MHVTKIVFKLISEQKQLSHCFHIVFFKSHTFVKMNDKKKEFNADSYTSNTIPVITSLTKITLHKIEKKLF